MVQKARIYCRVIALYCIRLQSCWWYTVIRPQKRWHSSTMSFFILEKVVWPKKKGQTVLSHCVFNWNIMKYIYSSTVNKYKFEMLQLNIFFSCYFLLVLHYISDVNVVLFTSTFLRDSFSYSTNMDLCTKTCETNTSTAETISQFINCQSLQSNTKQLNMSSTSTSYNCKILPLHEWVIVAGNMQRLVLVPITAWVWLCFYCLQHWNIFFFMFKLKMST